VQRLLWNDDVEKLGLAILIIAPGRELASQITSVTRELIQDTGLTVQLAIGGTTFTRNLEQIRKRKPNILVGTPGRLAELVVGKPGEK
jgi:superfamily II DNA/RNA helicase